MQAAVLCSQKRFVWKWMQPLWMAARLDAGEVGVRNVRNPIEFATEVMRNSNHVFKW